MAVAGVTTTTTSSSRVGAGDNDEHTKWLMRIISGVFVPIQAKDIFEAFYKKNLAKRLLLNRVVNTELEKQVVSLLKAECGTGYTSKMEGMFQDVEGSREITNLYKQALQAEALSNNSDVRVTVGPSKVDMEVQLSQNISLVCASGQRL
jgi:hypothetical protein